MACLRDNFSPGVLLHGRFQTIAPLNHGSFGMVFMAKDLVTSETVAVKVLTKKAAVTDAYLDFAIDDKSEELVLHRRLGSHANIVNLIQSFETDAHIYLVLEFCPRGDLYEAIRNGHGPLETEHVRRFMLELVDAVGYIHSKGIYHRDIKPENIFLSQSGAMKLGDFGLATTEKWSLESTVGSDRYMSPEQYDSAGAGYSPAQADIWAIGICLLNVLFSRNPFTTPTEADPLFLDFSRDKQSLFDVFPSMSQDTYEVIVQCMNLDPKKRSLVGAREALLRVVSFTTEDEVFDDFSSAERSTVPTANREPLRTPSIQSPFVDQGAFPWAKALQTGPRPPIRHLAAIPDSDIYEEELFSKSEETTDWCSASAQTPSLSSMLDSTLGASMQSLAINRSMKVAPRPIPNVSSMSGSLPIAVAKARTQPSLSLVFGCRPGGLVSKSWSDMWEEDAEGAEEEVSGMQTREDLDSRTWSQGSNDATVHGNDMDMEVPSLAIDEVESAVDNVVIKSDVDDDLVADGFFFHEPLPMRKELNPVPRYSPPSKRSTLDKWAALGERRRAYAGSLNTTTVSDFEKPHRKFGISFNSSVAGVWDQNNYNNKWGRERARSRPGNKGWDGNWRREKRPYLGDAEWVGGLPNYA